ncbi:hypothetical protein D3C73_1350510 [compost metagenome]
MARAFDQGMQADGQCFVTTLDEPAGDHQYGDDRKDHTDAELEKTGTQDAERYPKGAA